MRIEFLGTGGAIGLPRPTCDCRVCSEARARGVPYARFGPAVFVHGPDLLIDTPEDIVPALNRANIRRVGAVVWSHWHPDHTAGMRLFELLNVTLDWPPSFTRTPVYLPRGVHEDFAQFHSLWERVEYYERMGVLAPHVLADDEPFTLNGVTVEPYRLPDPSVQAYAYILTEGAARVLIAPDELFGWVPDPALGHFNLVVMQTGLFDVHPLTGERLIPAEHPVLQREATFEQTLEMARALDADRILLTHLYAHEVGSYDDLMKVQRKISEEDPALGRRVMFAFDRLAVMP
ncbi:MAG: hypothetical protein Kow0077_08050 [Anaerolineae bacterium]